MSDSTTLYRAILSQKYQTAKTAFQQVMQHKMRDVLTTQYRETAKTFITPPKPPQSS